ncbi:MAG TPA: hypothetical protein VNY05_22560 [Candidatus Acidoferrales bacterium]|nr:hypothetical protein [Candidatus Acidoferrales bacterium]
MQPDPNSPATRKPLSKAASLLAGSPAFQRLEPAMQAALMRDVQTIDTPDPHSHHDPYAFPLDTPGDLFSRRRQPADGGPPPAQPAAAAPAQPDPSAAADKSTPKAAATDTIARRTGALRDEVDFPAFVASLVHGTYDAVVDASIRQMEAFAELVGAVAKDLDQFTEENVTRNQVLDWLAHQYPRDLTLDVPVGPNAGDPALHARNPGSGEDDAPSPVWLADYGAAGQPLTDDLIEQALVPAARRKVGEGRLQTLATMVLLGMNRINVKDGSISAKVQFRAAAKDTAAVSYAASQDPGGQTWGERGSATYDQHQTMVSTVGANVQTTSDLKAELFGEVRINFVSETLPLDRFADSAKMAVLQKNGRSASSAPPAPPAAPSAQPALPAPAAPPAVLPAAGQPAATAPTASGPAARAGSARAGGKP